MNIKLWEAAQANDSALCQDLLNHEKHKDLTAQPNAKGLSNWTALHIAANQGALEAINVLLEPGYGVDIRARTSLGRTALHLAFLAGHYEVAEALLSHGADINEADGEGNTCLHLASSKGSISMANWLFSKRADPTVLNKLSKRPIDMAESLEMQRTLEGYLATLNQMCKRRSYGRTPFEGVLRHNSRVDTVNNLLAKTRTQVSAKALNDFYKRIRKERIVKTRASSPLRSVGENLHSDDEETKVDSVSYKDLIPLCLLGKGSFGEVYLVRQAHANKDYALKVIKKAEVYSRKLERYIMTEKRVLSYVKHPFIASLKAAFQTSEHLLILMDYIPGGELSSYLNREKRFDEGKSRLYICEIILAIEALHAHKVAYRDLKPGNLMLDSDGHIVLIDFGLAKEGMDADVVAKSFCGSPAYLAPEILNKTGHTVRVDWYQLGVVLYEMLTGAPPFFGHKRETMFEHICRGKLTFPKSISVEAKDLMTRLLERNPAERLCDPEAIKQHAFFAGVNWTDVYEKRVRMPATRFHRPKSQVISVEKIYGTKQLKNFEDWSFVAS